MASSTASAVSHYSVAIYDAYRRRSNRIKARRAKALEQLELVYASEQPASVETVKKVIKQAAPAVTMAEINEAVAMAKAQNDAMRVSVAQVQVQLVRMMQEMDDEAALAALL